MTGSELTHLILLASMMKWRVPKMDETFTDMVDLLNIEDLGMAIRAIDKKAKPDKAAIDRIMQEDIVQKNKRILLPGNPSQIYPLAPDVNDPISPF